ncbi:hypothetical protein ACWEKT_11925 [Nocardia takedensis]
MSDASVEVLLDDFESKNNWDLAGPGADRTHITTFVEGAPSKNPGKYADGAAGADHRAVALLVRAAAEGLDIELTPKPGKSFEIPGLLGGLNLWIRSPHAALHVYARVGTAEDPAEVLLGRVSAGAEWQRAEHVLTAPLTDAAVLGLRLRLTEIVKRSGEVMILLDDLTASTAR